MNKEEFKQTKSKIIRIKRISHTKAGGRILGYQALAIYGNSNDSFGWAVCKSNSPQDCRMKAIKKAGQKMRHVNFNKNTKSFFKDTVITFNHYKIKIKKARPGTGITANPLVSLILNYSGIENACVKIINKPDILLLIKHLSKFLHGN